MLAFVHIEKAAGSTVVSILRQSYGARHCDAISWGPCSVHDDYYSAQDLRRTKRFYRRIDSLSGHSIKPHSDLQTADPAVEYFTFLREPLARCASHYQYQLQILKKKITLDDWLQDPRYRNFQVRKLAGQEDAQRAIQILCERISFVGLVERFDESVVMLKRRLEDVDLRIAYRRRKVAKDSAIKRQLLGDSRTRSLLLDANRHDIELYNTAVNTIFPRQVDQYGPGFEQDVQDFKNSNICKAVQLPLCGWAFRRAVHRAARNVLLRIAA